MDWKQKLLDAQVSVNRSVFEMNRPGLAGELYRFEPNLEYIRNEIEDAISDLQKAEVMINTLLNK